MVQTSSMYKSNNNYSMDFSKLRIMIMPHNLCEWLSHLISCDIVRPWNSKQMGTKCSRIIMNWYIWFLQTDFNAIFILSDLSFLDILPMHDLKWTQDDQTV